MTGGAGFLGSHLVEGLIDKGYHVKILVRPGKDIAFLEDIGAEGVFADLMNVEEYEDKITEGSIVIHNAALTPGYKAEKSKYFKVNVGGTEGLLEACKKKKVSKFVLISTGGVVGPTKGELINESTKENPDSFYGESKLEAEKIVREFYEETQIPSVILRPFVFFGERMPQRSGGATVFRMVRKDKMFLVQGLKGSYEYSYVKNVVNGVILAMEKVESFALYNLTNVKKKSFGELVSVMKEIVNPNLKIVPIPLLLAKSVGVVGDLVAKVRKKKVLFSGRNVRILNGMFAADASMIVRELGYEEDYSLEDGVKRTNEWIKENW